MPRDNQDGRARRGYLLLAGIGLAAALIFSLNAVRDFARDRIELVALLPDASGVRVGTSVRVAGMEAGRVTGVEFLGGRGPYEVALRVLVDGAAADAVLRHDSDVRAVRMRTVGQPVVQLEAGSAMAPPVDEGDTLRSRSRMGPDELLARGRELPAALDSLLRSARQVQAMARARAPDLERLQMSVEAVTAAASTLTAQLEGGTLGRLMAPGALDGLARLQATLNALTAEVDRALGRYAGLGTDGIGGTDADGAALAARLEGLAGRVATLQTQIDGLSRRFAAGEGMLNRMAADSALQVALRRLQAQVDTLGQEAASIGMRMLAR